jgi:hypothetical protein
MSFASRVTRVCRFDFFSFSSFSFYFYNITPIPHTAHRRIMADPVLQLLLKQEKGKLPNVPEKKELPPTPTMTANLASLSGPSVSFSDANESWTDETPRSC